MDAPNVFRGLGSIVTDRYRVSQMLKLAALTENTDFWLKSGSEIHKLYV